MSKNHFRAPKLLAHAGRIARTRQQQRPSGSPRTTLKTYGSRNRSSGGLAAQRAQCMRARSALASTAAAVAGSTGRAASNDGRTTNARKATCRGAREMQA